jgi:hypothetical protein
MKISGLIQNNIFQVSVGGILNKRKIGKRRNVFFFEEIGANYVKKCEKAGYSKEMMDVGQEWMAVFFSKMIPLPLKKIPPVLLLNMIIRNLWITGGLMSDFHASKRGNVVIIETKNEGLTRIVKGNNLMIGFYAGILNALFEKEIQIIESLQSKKTCKYSFRLGNKKFIEFNSKEKSFYDKLNYFENASGFTLKNLLERKIFCLKEDNMTYFRGKFITPIETTLFHLLGNGNILLDKVPGISYDYFREIIREGSDISKLTLLKTLLQAMGWGIIKMSLTDRKIVLEIKNPPYGLQKGRDNWDFLLMTVLGYLWTLDRGFRMQKTETRHRYVKAVYVR